MHCTCRHHHCRSCMPNLAWCAAVHAGITQHPSRHRRAGGPQPPSSSWRTRQPSALCTPPQFVPGGSAEGTPTSLASSPGRTPAEHLDAGGARSLWPRGGAHYSAQTLFWSPGDGTCLNRCRVRTISQELVQDSEMSTSSKPLPRFLTPPNTTFNPMRDSPTLLHRVLWSWNLSDMQGRWPSPSSLASVLSADTKDGRPHLQHNLTPLKGLGSGGQNACLHSPGGHHWSRGVLSANGCTSQKSQLPRRMPKRANDVQQVTSHPNRN